MATCALPRQAASTRACWFPSASPSGTTSCPASSALCRFICNPPPSASMCCRWMSCWWTLARRTRTKPSAKPRWGRTSPSIRPMWNTAMASRAARHSTTASAACRCCVCCKKNCRLTSWLALCPKRKSAAAARRGQRSSRNPTSALCWKARRATTSATYRRLRTSAKPDRVSRCRSWMARQLRTERCSARRWTWRSRRTFRIR